jgi:3-carboxy-cis,cis-muconate cycloisomerase
MRTALEGLEVRPERMRANLELTRGLLLAEHAMMELAERIGRGEAKRVVEAAAARATESGGELRDELAADAAVSEHLSAAEIDRALDPAGYLGSADAFIDRALERYRR